MTSKTASKRNKFVHPNTIGISIAKVSIAILYRRIMYNSNKYYIKSNKRTITFEESYNSKMRIIYKSNKITIARVRR